MIYYEVFVSVFAAGAVGNDAVAVGAEAVDQLVAEGEVGGIEFSFMDDAGGLADEEVDVVED